MKHLYAITLALFLGLATTHAAKRVAFIWTCSDYEHLADLTNVKQDGPAFAAALPKDFAVTQWSPAGAANTRANFTAAFEKFCEENKDAEEIIFYYSGHGFQTLGINFLAPTDAKLDLEDARQYAKNRGMSPQLTETHLQTEFSNLIQQGKVSLMPLDFISDKISKMGTLQVPKVIILDACRVDELASKSIFGASAGFNGVKAPQGVLIALATEEGKEAGQTHQGISRFTGFLVKNMTLPGACPTTPYFFGVKKRFN